jgi:hypothetical protein
MALSADGGALFVAGRDGSLVVFDVKDSEGRLVCFDGTVRVPASDEVLIAQAAWDGKRAAIRGLLQAVADAQGKAEYRSREREDEHGAQLKAMTDTYHTEINLTRLNRELVDEERGDLDRDVSDAITAGEASHAVDMARREAAFQSRIMVDVDSFSALSGDIKALTREFSGAAEKAAARRAALAAKREAAHAEAVAVLVARRARSLAAIPALRRSAAEAMQQGAEAGNEEVSALQADVAARVGAQQEVGLKAKVEMEVMAKKMGEVRVALERGREDIRRRKHALEEQAARIEALEEELVGLRAAAAEVDTRIDDKEKRIGGFAEGTSAAPVPHAARFPTAHHARAHPNTRSGAAEKRGRAGKIQVRAGRKDPRAAARGGAPRAGN